MSDIMSVQAAKDAAQLATDLKSLGSGHTAYPTQYDPSVLEVFPSAYVGEELEQLVGLDAFEFSSLCPKTHQPDLGSIHIAYIPDKLMVESKSLKLYLFSFRSHGAFHESCVRTIMDDLVKLLQPKYLEVYGDFNSRGGISILPFCNYADKHHMDLKRTRMAGMMAQMADRKH